MTSSSNVATIVDQLGIVKAKMADLAAEETALKNSLLEMGAGSYEGDFFRATVSVSERESLDTAALREHLSAKMIAAYTKVTQVSAVRVSARSAAIASHMKKAA